VSSRRWARQYDVPIVYPHQALCTDKACDILRDGQPLYTDGHHLSVHGTAALAPMLGQLVASAKAPAQAEATETPVHPATSKPQ
jgi:hypothetical protein